MDKEKLKFFNRVKIAILKFDEYEQFIIEDLKKAIIFYTKLVLCFSIIMTIVICYALKLSTTKVIDKINNEVPNFTISEEKLEIDEANDFQLYLDELNIQLKMDENQTNTDKSDYTNRIELLKNKMFLTYMGYTQEISYKDINTSKEDITNYLKSSNMLLTLLFVGVFVLITTFGIYYIVFFVDIIMLAVVGMAINLLIKIPIKFNKILTVAIYSMTLPIILYLLYSMANVLFKITIEYFAIAYNSISYIYLITVLLIFKTNLIKNTQELQKVLEEEKKVREELERKRQEEKKQEEENKKKKEKKKKEKNPSEPEAEPEG